LSRFFYALWGIGLISLSLAGCTAANTGQTNPSEAPLQATQALVTDTPAVTATPEPPTATPEPLAARVNDVAISEADFIREVARFELAHQQQGQALPNPDEYLPQVLDSMILEELIVQSAGVQGLAVLPADVDVVYQQSVDAMGGPEAFAKFLTDNLYTEEEYRTDLERSLLVSAVQNVIISQVPTTAEQVHARQILVSSREQADSLYQQLQSGSDFATLAEQFSQDNNTRFNGGDLDWFPRGTLIDPTLEDALFALEPNQYTAVIETFLGFHILQLVEKQADRELTQQARVALQDKYLHNWRQGLIQNAVIERFVP